jgi:hypothetical protein
VCSWGSITICADYLTLTDVCGWLSSKLRICSPLCQANCNEPDGKDSETWYIIYHTIGSILFQPDDIFHSSDHQSLSIGCCCCYHIQSIVLITSTDSETDWQKNDVSKIHEITQNITILWRSMCCEMNCRAFLHYLQLCKIMPYCYNRQQRPTMQHRPEEAKYCSVLLEATCQENTQHTTFCSGASNKHAQYLTRSPGKWSQGTGDKKVECWQHQNGHNTTGYDKQT